jgi:hypothetical protein
MIKPKTFLISFLFLPYLLWVVSVPLMLLRLDSFLHTIIASFSIVYNFGIAFWGIPYTTFVLGVLIWSRGKSAEELYAVLSRTPILLAQITLAEFVLANFLVGIFALAFAAISGEGHKIDFLELIGGSFGSFFLALIAILGVLIYGYPFMFLGKAAYGIFKNRRWFKKDDKNALQMVNPDAGESVTDNLGNVKEE